MCYLCLRFITLFILHNIVISQRAFRFRLFFAPTLVLFFEGRSAAYLCSFG
ncbi:hypothetical protein GCHA_0612 [Paraglaciecola chathamensis S18K6]|uniref:Uncharacterized protein n=1 Tax=Paraglaciecola chathamensis S18K6 TaxID=1127672 RepID=A0AAV3UU53_9ALTE|nr:hypothetical protein GCHA_0612 [Paraglaciecola chathamensis S18K6]